LIFEAAAAAAAVAAATSGQGFSSLLVILYPGFCIKIA